MAIHLPQGSRRTRVAAVAALLVVAVIGLGVVSLTRPSVQPSACAPITDHPAWSVARRWDEALLDAIRRALPNPPLHARNLFHLSAAMWAAWAAYDPTAEGYFVNEKEHARDVSAARDEAISHAAYRLLSARFRTSVGGPDSLAEFDRVMKSLCLDREVTTTRGDTPAALGNRIARAVLDSGLRDGSNEAIGYIDPDYEPVNPPLIVAQSGTFMNDPNRWQPLQLEHMMSQNGIELTNGTQQAIGPHWGHVTPFAISPGGPAGVPIDPGPPPRLGDPGTDRAFKEQAVEVIRDSARLDSNSDATLDISPGARGGNDLGTNDGQGHPVNPATGQPYAPEVARQGDFSRALAEFWADGPKSETPPGHWNVIANAASDQLDPNLRIGGSGAVVDRLEWDVKLYFALNGAVHDAAIAAWGLKGRYDGPRPISMIRYMGRLGQSSDPNGPSYDPEGLPLVPGLIEVVTAATAAPGQRHGFVGGTEGMIAIRAWKGNPPDPQAQQGGVGWILAVDWVPYQVPTFVTPSFQGYVSGHSTFSRAAAEVLTGFTGSEYFPGGLSEWPIPVGSLKVEAGPSADVVLQWGTYYDAADQAGQSRLFGGIHVQADDFTGRVIGAQCGKAAWELARRYFSGTVGAP